MGRGEQVVRSGDHEVSICELGVRSGEQGRRSGEQRGAW